MKIRKFKLRKIHCRSCGHKWVPRISDPVLCPRCKNPYWVKARIRFGSKRYLAEKEATGGLV